MKVVHIESGLGNQMLGYCEYLALRQANPEDDCYIETLVYEFPEAAEVICQWNGYELERIFGIQAPNVRQVLSETQWMALTDRIRRDAFWKRHWNWPVLFCEAFAIVGLPLKNVRGDMESPENLRKNDLDVNSLKYKLKQTRPYLLLKYAKQRLCPVKSRDHTGELFLKTGESILTGHRLAFHYRGSGMERIEGEVREAFRFPPMTDERNRNLLAYIQSVNAVAIHARRGDMLSVNGWCYKNGYFRRAVGYIKKHTADPVFFFFCDPGSIAWCREHEKIFGLNSKTDNIFYVDWNRGGDSFRDMQLMAACRHNVITNSSFGWWGAWLNENPDKITCSPDPRYDTTHTF